MQHLVGRAQNSSCAADSSASVCVYVSILQVRPDLQAEEDEASRAMLKASIIFLANPCSLCTTILPILANGLQSGHLSGEFRWCLLSWPSCVMS